jgi:hypothetical protein
MLSSFARIAVALVLVACSSPKKSKTVDAAPAPDALATPDGPGTGEDVAVTSGLDVATEAPALPVVACQDFLAHQRSCGRLVDGGPDSEEICAGLAASLEKWRPEFSATFLACYVTHDCNNDDDDCVYQGLRASGGDLIDFATLEICLRRVAAGEQPCEVLPFVGIAADCMQRREVCTPDGSPSAFADDRCLTIPALTETQRAKVPGCLALECAAIGSCLRDLGTLAP